MVIGFAIVMICLKLKTQSLDTPMMSMSTTGTNLTVLCSDFRLFFFDRGTLQSRCEKGTICVIDRYHGFSETNTLPSNNPIRDYPASNWPNIGSALKDLAALKGRDSVFIQIRVVQKDIIVQSDRNSLHLDKLFLDRSLHAGDILILMPVIRE
jgi:hypothetical protein